MNVYFEARVFKSEWSLIPSKCPNLENFLEFPSTWQTVLVPCYSGDLRIKEAGNGISCCCDYTGLCVMQEKHIFPNWSAPCQAHSYPSTGQTALLLPHLGHQWPVHQLQPNEKALEWSLNTPSIPAPAASSVIQITHLFSTLKL